MWKGRQMRSSSQDPSRDMQALPSLRLQQFSEGVSWPQGVLDHAASAIVTPWAVL